MADANERDLQSTMRVLQELWRLTEPEATAFALRAMFDLVPCDFSAIGWLDTRTGRIGTLSWPPAAVEPVSLQDPYLVASHPLVAAIAVQGPATLRISDVISDRDWRNHPTRAAMAEGMGNRSQQLERELGLGTFSGPIIYNYAVNRIGPDFSDRDREVIAMLAPGIARHRQLLVRAASLEALFEQAMHDGPVHAVVVDPAGRLEHASGQGAELYEANHRGADGWVAREMAPQSLPPGYRLVLFTPERPALSAREALVLGLVSEGGTSTAIGRRLGISTRTADKHLEHIYRKLDVADRASAVRRALELRLLPQQRRSRPGLRSVAHGQAPS